MTEELKKLGRKENATLYNILLSTFKILLYKYSGQSDICIGTPIANRTKSGSDSIFGMLVNTLPLKINIENDDTFIDVLNRVKTTVQEAYRYQAVPFSKIIDELEIPRDQSRTPLFQTMFVMQNASITSEFNTSTIELEDIEFESGTSVIYISIEVSNMTPKDKLAVEWNYLESGDEIKTQATTGETGSGYIGFNLIKKDESFPTGNYNVLVYLNDELYETLEFLVK